MREVPGKKWKAAFAPDLRNEPRRLIVRPEAEADILEAALWYEEKEPGLGVDLVFEVRSAIQRATEIPRFTCSCGSNLKSDASSRGAFLIAYFSSCVTTQLWSSQFFTPPGTIAAGRGGCEFVICVLTEVIEETKFFLRCLCLLLFKFFA
jgi:hypothetical protein